MIMECTDNKSNLIKWHLICCICWWFLCLIYNDASDIEKDKKKKVKKKKQTQKHKRFVLKVCEIDCLYSCLLCEKIKL